MRSIIQVCENTVLPLEDVVVFVPRCLVVRIPIHASALKVPDLRDALLSIAHLFVEEAGLFCVRVNVWLTIDNVMDLTTSIVYAFAMVQ